MENPCVCVGVLEEEEKSVGPQFWARTNFSLEKKETLLGVKVTPRKKS